MNKEIKKLITDISADIKREEALIKYQKHLAALFSEYATIKMSMNLFTLYEMSEEIDLSRREEIEEYIDIINTAIRGIYIDNDTEGCIDDVSEIRDKITERMKILTAYTDALEIYEYILNRKEPEILGTIDESIDTDQLANNMYEYVFSDKDKMLINTRIQDFIAQLPVRMAKNRFFDIISNSLFIYKGGEKKSAQDFVQTIRDGALLSMPDNLQDYYPEVYEIYSELKSTDYSGLSKEQYDNLKPMLDKAAGLIQAYVTDYLMLTEIINDVLIVLYTYKYADKNVYTDQYKAAARILVELVSADDIYAASESFDKLFVELEGAQERAYEELAFADSYLEDLSSTYSEMFENESIRDRFNDLQKADMLTSSSLFMDINNNEFTIINEEADEGFILGLKDELTEDFKKAFTDMGKLEKRSVMAKVLSLMPVFFNSQQEILDYFSYALSSCSDKSELTACRDIINDMMI